ncbi:hypothetical protein PtrSN002B_004232 [Pyrenophora tritici-repentis]|uniref:SWIM-type domain-containing protein n=2 Tax=Pyrenophora tritici-repentis TaxID=45151 RepID=A0A2W1GZW4_9PLEO|nr:uncharacterized protein PTRG_04020 [Pyrenophora tritici-repentis Pt-1C-BFP]KAA8619908.1 hypothetical protein PtrV1_07002 [Pyrenophora tritici-repentis]EDU46858.1 conserved hypothetical protein [Pyrenophora tritici-repentis Pt-1C-BFP]KAF7448050.1 hypothetical protein A1F99_074140 [Pyrenophora tritici-repentis]KAF7571755.1 hypothetical protein PtrM4_092550 [Pyrenophora tritici-repentis]KAG9385035.1 hypothetical protein A1F94_004582 [Pyrenophora tritici-repentis]
MSSPAVHTHRLFVTRLLNSLPTVTPRSGEVTAAEENPLGNVSDAVKKQLLALQVLFPNEFVPALDLLDRCLVTRHRICDSSQRNAHANETQREAADMHMQGTGEATHSRDAPMRDAETRNAPAIHEASNMHEATNHALDTSAQDEGPPDVTIRAAPDTTYSNDIVYYVASAQQRSSRFSTSYESKTCYEVRLQAWNCSCPAFAFAAFPATNNEVSVSSYDTQNEADGSDSTEEAGDTAWLFGGISLGDGMPPICKHLLACVLAERCSGLFGGFVEEKTVSVEEAAGWAAGWGD